MVFDKVGRGEEGRTCRWERDAILWSKLTHQYRWKVVSFGDSGGAEAEAEQEETSDLRREVGTDYWV